MYVCVRGGGIVHLTSTLFARPFPLVSMATVSNAPHKKKRNNSPHSSNKPSLRAAAQLPRVTQQIGGCARHVRAATG